MFSQMLDHFSRRSRQERSTFAALDIVCLSSELLVNFLKSTATPDFVRKKLLESGVLYFHLVWKLCEKEDMAGLEKLMQFHFQKHLGIQLF